MTLTDRCACHWQNASNDIHFCDVNTIVWVLLVDDGRTRSIGRTFTIRSIHLPVRIICAIPPEIGELSDLSRLLIEFMNGLSRHEKQLTASRGIGRKMISFWLQWHFAVAKN